MTAPGHKRGPKPPPPQPVGPPPKPPTWLGLRERKVFRDTAKELAAAGLAARADVELLTAFSIATVALRRVATELESLDALCYVGPNNARCLDPRVKLRSDLISRVGALASTLGLGAPGRKRAGGAARTQAAPDKSRDPTHADFYIRRP